MLRRKLFEHFKETQQFVRHTLSKQSSNWQESGYRQVRYFNVQAKSGGRKLQSPPVTYTTLFVSASMGALMVWYYQKTKIEREREFMKPTNEVIGSPMVGAPFELVDHNGKPFNSDTLKGEFVLIYFGFTHCPDICPDELEKMAGAVNIVKEKTGHCVQPIMVTVDPARDTVKQIREYVKEFHPKMIGLTGENDVVREVCKAYRVYFMNTGYHEEDYLVDHSIITYLLDPEGQFVTFFGKNFDAEMISNSVKRYIKRWRKSNPEYTGRKEWLYDTI